MYKQIILEYPRELSLIQLDSREESLCIGVSPRKNKEILNN